MTYTMSYANRLRNLLLAAGTLGVTQHELNQRSKTRKYNISDMLMVLTAWQKRLWVERYPDPSYSGRYYWRATQLLIDQWPIITTVIDELITGQLSPSELSLAPSRTSVPAEEDPEPATE